MHPPHSQPKKEVASDRELSEGNLLHQHKKFHLWVADRQWNIIREGLLYHKETKLNSSFDQYQ
eukprot:UN27493